jgi:GT2 family glycosyltransferase
MNTSCPVVSIIIVSYNTSAILRDCLRSIERETLLAHEVIVVDNVSTDDTCAMVEREFPNVRLVRNAENKGFARANNQGLKLVSGEYVCFLNPDTIILRGALDALVSYAHQHPHIGLLGPHVFNADGASDQATAFWFPTVARLALAHIPLAALLARFVGAKTPPYRPYVPRASGQVELVSGCCMLMPTSLARDIGGMNEEYFMYSEELDLCEGVVKRGREVCYLKEASIIHLGGASTAPSSDRMAVELLRSMMRYFRRVQPQAVPRVRLLYSIGSAWRWAVWSLLWLVGVRRTEARLKQSNHRAMLRWLWQEFDF